MLSLYRLRPLTTTTALPLPKRPIHPLGRQPRHRPSRPELPPRPGSDQESRYHRARLPGSRRHRQLQTLRRAFSTSLLGITGSGRTGSPRVLEEVNETYALPHSEQKKQSIDDLDSLSHTKECLERAADGPRDVFMN